MIELKSAKELAAMVKDEARKTGKCYNLSNVTAVPYGNPGNWDYRVTRNSAGLSEECQNELTAIVIELKKRYRLKPK